MASADEDLAKAFSFGVNVTQDLHNTALTTHPSRLTEYKGHYAKSGDQENRRKNILDRQKQKRFDAANYARKLVEGDLNETDLEEATMDTTTDLTNNVSEKKVKRFNPYKNQLMLSEWLIDPPNDLDTSWTMVVCPVGKRVLVISHRGHTSAYTKNGYLLNKFPSLLPGGSFKTWQKQSSSYTLLDCVFDEANHTFWILDLMCLNGHPIYDSETDFRFFWMTTKLLEEYPNIIKQSKPNPYKFQPLPHISCTTDCITHAITDQYPFLIDGLLFYHRLSHYQPGRTPLVGWLKPYMVEEILGIPMPDCVLKNAPVEFNKVILKEANVKLQDTVSDRSFDNPYRDEKKEIMET